MDKIKLAVVVPCYNEELALAHNIPRFMEVLHSLIKDNIITNDSFLCFVDDGSADKTWNLIQEAYKKDKKYVKGIRFTRNFGNQNAILAGLEFANKTKVDCAITIDADLQQDENKIKDFIIKYNEGAEIVYGIRNDRKNDNFFKKCTSTLFYKVMNLLGANLIPNHSEFRLMSKKALDVIEQYNERNLFLRGVFCDTGLRKDYIYFDVKKREHGTSKFSFLSLLKLAAWGITSFSIRPLRLIFYTGLIISSVSFIVAFIQIYQYFLKDNYMSFIGMNIYQIIQMFISGIQILCIGIIGEYIGQILQEVKGRPRHIIDVQLD